MAMSMGPLPVDPPPPPAPPEPDAAPSVPPVPDRSECLMQLVSSGLVLWAKFKQGGFDDLTTELASSVPADVAVQQFFSALQQLIVTVNSPR